MPFKPEYLAATIALRIAALDRAAHRLYVDSLSIDKEQSAVVEKLSTDIHAAELESRKWIESKKSATS